MNKSRSFLLLIVFLCLTSNIILPQNKIPFGEISFRDIQNSTYKPDPGADAIILADNGIASLNYDGNKFFVELVRDVKIRIVNSNGFDYANIELPFSSDDDIISYKASTFNLREGEIVETPISRKSFIIDYSSRLGKALKFSFPDVHEGSVLEYSYTVRLRDNAVYMLVPWYFQSVIPVVSSTLTIAYPEYFTYKTSISGSAKSVFSRYEIKESNFYNERINVNIMTWFVNEMPAFRAEPLMKSRSENLTGISFELASTNFPGSSYEEITPTYKSLTEKLLERSDFGDALSKTSFLNKKTFELTSGLNDDLSKLKKIHEFVSEKILWNGVEDFTASGSLARVYNKEKGNSADINLILIGMLRAAKINADPVILSTRSNGSLNKFSAMIQQFNYVVANVFIDGDYYLVDATDPLRPFNVLPSECLNDEGWLVNDYDSKFIKLTNNEKDALTTSLKLEIDGTGNLTGEIRSRYSDINAYSFRKLIKLEGEDGYLDLKKALATETEISAFRLENKELRDSDIVEVYNIRIKNGTQIAGDRLLVNPFLSLIAGKNTFNQDTRKYPIDFGARVEKILIVNLVIPQGFSVVETPQDGTVTLGKGDGIYKFSCRQSGNTLMINSHLTIDRTLYQPSEYPQIQDFYSRILKKQSELIMLKKNL